MKISLKKLEKALGKALGKKVTITISEPRRDEEFYKHFNELMLKRKPLNLVPMFDGPRVQFRRVNPLTETEKTDVQQGDEQ